MTIFTKYASNHSSYIAINSSCYNLETQDLLKCLVTTEVSEALQSITKLQYKVNFLKEEQTRYEDSMCYLVQLLGWVLIAGSFVISNGITTFLRVLET